MTSSVASTLQKKKKILDKVDTEVNNMIENFTSIIREARVCKKILTIFSCIIFHYLRSE